MSFFGIGNRYYRPFKKSHRSFTKNVFRFRTGSKRSANVFSRGYYKGLKKYK